LSEANKTPEQLARDNIDAMLSSSGWVVQDKKFIDFNASLGMVPSFVNHALRELQGEDVRELRKRVAHQARN
jgi:hypothetical protein